MTNTSDEDPEAFLARFCAGHSDAHEMMKKLIKQAVAMVRQVSMGDRETVEMHTQSSVWELLCAKSRRIEKSLPGFLKHRARACFQEWRGKRRHTNLEDILEPTSNAPPPDGDVENREGLKPRLEVCLSRIMNDNHRETWELRHLKGLSTEDIARRMDAKPALVRLWLFRANHSLRECIGLEFRGWFQ